MSKAFIRALSSAVKRATSAQELLFRQKNPTEDIVEVIEHMDSLINILHGLREEEIEIARFNSNFLENPYEEQDELDEIDE